jgi:hypothetical protein
MRNNEVWSTGTSFVDTDLKYAGEQNRYIVVSADPSDLRAARSAFAMLPEKGSTVAESRSGAVVPVLRPAAGSWQLIASFPAALLQDERSELLRGTLVELKSAALQFGHSGLKVTLASAARAEQIVEDWQLRQDGIEMDVQPAGKVSGFSLKLISPAGKVVREWRSYPGPTGLGLELQRHLGAPNFSHLGFENVRATG